MVTTMTERVETLALLFTDIEGSTKLLRELGPDYRKLLAEHRRLLREAFEAHDGRVIGSEGDSLFVAFQDPVAAIRAVVDGQLALSNTRWPADAELRVRMGIHHGEVIIEGDDYFGLSVHQAARISNAAHGTQVLISEATKNSADRRIPEGISLKPLGQFRLKDFPEPQELYQLSHPDLPADFPAPRTAGGARHNLPRALTSFIGRDRDLAELIDLLETRRLVTLTGPGGCGKTRLAIESASASLPVRPDGIWFVDLAPVSDPALVVATAAEAMGVQETQRSSADDAVTEFLSAGRPLLILDNCEHLIATCAEVAERWLSSCPGLTILVTAREPLGIAGEVIRRVPGLSAEDPPEGEAGGSEAVQLFVERARAHDPEFEPEEGEVAEIGHLARRLDGIPLAIEMAAALIGTLSVSEIVSRLDDRFRLLTGGTGRTLGRQQTLLATVDWSHELLSETERVLLRRLSVMSGSFSLDDVESICVGDGIDAAETISLIRRLVATSWVIRERAGDHTRYRLLETSRQYALDKLVASSEAERMRSRHCEWFAELAGRASSPMLGGPDQARWFERVELDLDNFRSAMSWGLGEGSAVLALRLATALSRFWEVRGHWSEGLRSLEQALAQTPDAGDEVRGPALVAASFLAFYRGQLDSARSMAEEGLAAARRSGDGPTESRGLRFAAVIEQRMGNLPAALDSAEKAVAVSRSAGKPADLAFALQVLGRLLAPERRDEARARYEEGLEVARACEDAVSQIYLLYALGQLSIREGDNDRARDLFNEALDLSQRVGERWMGMNVLVGLGQVSDEIDAGSAVEEMVGLMRQVGNPMMMIIWLRQLAYRQRLEGDIEGARRSVDEALRFVEKEGSPEAQVLGHYIRGSHLDEAEHDNVGALREFRDGVRLAADLNNRWEVAFGLGGVARQLTLTGEQQHAAVLLGAAEKIREVVGMLPVGRRAEAHRELVEEIGKALGDSERDGLMTKGRAMSLEGAIAFATEGV
jgi:predicted ATPase/class 3 adenylate cyclase